MVEVGTDDGTATDPEDGVGLVRRVNVALLRDAAEALAKLSERTGMKQVDVVNRALQVFEWVDSEQRAGNQLIVRGSEGDTVVKIL
ncbi:MAG TPA: hypothetical protein VGW74_19770 [Propionibacteriaceae bacterium]|nr:hypothetical protein [Propionibacteriaceae bacterium]